MESKLQDEHARNVCGLGNGIFTCSFLVSSAGGFECVKNSEFEQTICMRRGRDDIYALGVNCSGPPDFTITKKTVN